MFEHFSNVLPYRYTVYILESENLLFYSRPSYKKILVKPNRQTFT